MTAPMGYNLFSGVVTSETAMGTTMRLPRGCLTIFTLREWGGYLINCFFRRHDMTALHVHKEAGTRDV